MSLYFSKVYDYLKDFSFCISSRGNYINFGDAKDSFFQTMDPKSNPRWFNKNYFKQHLDTTFFGLDLDSIIKKDITELLDSLFDININEFQQQRIELNESLPIFFDEFDKLGCYFNYYVDPNGDCRDNMIFFILKCIKRYNIEKYIDLTYNEIYDRLCELFRFSSSVTKFDKDIPNDGSFGRQNIKDFKEKLKINKESYDEYEKKRDNHTLDIDDSGEISKWCEDQSYDMEKNLFLSNGCNKEEINKYVKWVAKDYGDGYGFDVLSYDLETKREKLIEVKYRRTSNLDITSNEYDTARMVGNRSDYYVYFFHLDYPKKQIVFRKYKYNYSEDCFKRVDEEVCFNVLDPIKDTRHREYPDEPKLYVDDFIKSQNSYNLVNEDSYNNTKKDFESHEMQKMFNIPNSYYVKG